MNILQRMVLIAAASFLFMLAFGVATGSYGGSAWLALVEFAAGVTCLFFALSSNRGSRDAG